MGCFSGITDFFLSVSGSRTGKGTFALQHLHHSKLKMVLKTHAVYFAVQAAVANFCQCCFSLIFQLLGNAGCILPKETNRLQPPHQPQQSLLHLSGDRWNQPDPTYRLRGWPASLLAAGASQRGPGQHEQCGGGLCLRAHVCVSPQATRLSHQVLHSLPTAANGIWHVFKLTSPPSMRWCNFLVSHAAQLTLIRCIWSCCHLSPRIVQPAQK